MQTNDFDIAGVTFESARAWLDGKFHVGDRIADSPLDLSRCEVVFANELGNRESYRAAVAEIQRLASRGALALVAHAVGPMVQRYQRQGGLVCGVDNITWRGERYQSARILVPPADFKAWLAKLPDFPGVTTAEPPGKVAHIQS